MTLLAEGVSAREVARRVRAAVGSVSRWQQAWRQGGEAALAAKLVPGAPRQVTDPPREPWRQLLLQGARAAGFPNELWTVKRMAAVMQVHFGVRDHPAHVWKIVRGLGWRGQVPERRAIQRDEPAIAHWQRYQWPAIKNSPPAGRSSGLPG